MFAFIYKLSYYSFFTLVVPIFFLVGCQTSPKIQPNPLAHLPENLKDFKLADFVENRILVVQTCFRDKKINVRTQEVQMPEEALPLTVCQRRQTLGQPCPKNWQSSEPLDAAMSFMPIKTVRIWSATGAQNDLAVRWISTGSVMRFPFTNSAGGGGSSLRDVTTEKQPVFEDTVSDPKYLFAWDVETRFIRETEKRNLKFWFLPPTFLRLNEFTQWKSADSGDDKDRDQGYRMANNGDFPKIDVTEGSPFVRFGLFTYRQYNDSVRIYDYVYKRAQPIIKLKEGYKDNNEFQILRTGSAEIPAC